MSRLTLESCLDQLRSYSDERLVVGCIYCGGTEETREHVPSRIFLDMPFPENLPVVGACWKCNNGFSSDEEYLACLIESVLAGSTDPDHIHRQRIGALLRRSAGLRARLEAMKSLVNGRLQFGVEQKRVSVIVTKLARGHAVFELGQSPRGDPTAIWWHPIELMNEDDRASFEAVEAEPILGEIGSRSSQRLLVAQISLRSSTGEDSKIHLLMNDWIEVQAGRYRYYAFENGEQIAVKMVIREYLACEVAWNT